MRLQGRRWIRKVERVLILFCVVTVVYLITTDERTLLTATSWGASRHLTQDDLTKTQPTTATTTRATTLPPPTTQAAGLRENSWIPVNCRRIISGSKPELERARTFMKLFKRLARPDGGFVDVAQNCSSFTAERGYIMRAGPTEEERRFPIAFSILGYQNVDQIEQLLRVIYRPQNFYCIHMDKFSSREVQQGMAAVAKCLPNVAMATKQAGIVYAGFPRLKADLHCMEDALQSKVDWKYIINLSAEMFPLKTNWELVQILKVYNGANDVEGLEAGPHSWRWRTKFVVEGRQIIRTNVTKAPPPHQMTITKGSAYGVFSRGFIQYALHDPWAKDLLKWMEDTYSPDEQFFPTLHNALHNPHLNVPGSFKGDYRKNKWLAIYAHWFTGDNPCPGKNLRGICLPSITDLAQLTKRNELFLNKLKPYEDDYVVAHCLKEWYWDRVERRPPLNLTVYRSLPFMKEREGHT